MTSSWSQFVNDRLLRRPGGEASDAGRWVGDEALTVCHAGRNKGQGRRNDGS